MPEPPFTEQMQEKTETPSNTPQKRVTAVTSSDETASESVENAEEEEESLPNSRDNAES